MKDVLLAYSKTLQLPLSSAVQIWLRQNNLLKSDSLIYAGSQPRVKQQPDSWEYTGVEGT